MITLRHSVDFQCNLVHEQTMTTLTIFPHKMYDLFLLFLHNFGFSKKWHFANYTTSAVNLESLGLDTLSNAETRKLCMISKHGLVVHKFNILLS